MLYSHRDPVYLCLKKNDGDIGEKLNDFRNDGFFSHGECSVQLSFQLEKLGYLLLQVPFSTVLSLLNKSFDPPPLKGRCCRIRE